MLYNSPPEYETLQVSRSGPPNIPFSFFQMTLEYSHVIGQRWDGGRGKVVRSREIEIADVADVDLTVSLPGYGRSVGVDDRVESEVRPWNNSCAYRQWGGDNYCK